jgi:hypothetical protein
MANMRKSRRLRRNKKSARRVQRRTDRNTMRQQGGAEERQFWSVETADGKITANKIVNYEATNNIIDKKNFNDFLNKHIAKQPATMALSLTMGDGTKNDAGVIQPVELSTAKGSDTKDGVI